MSTVAVAVIVSASVALMLIRPRKIAEVWWVGGGARLLVASGLLPLSEAATAIRKGDDVYAFLAGMMLLSELARSHGVFEWLAALSVRSARGSCARLFAIVYGVGALVTIFMSNDATAVVLTPAILAAVRKAKVEPLPYLFVCALVANAASFVLPISNPANLVVFHGAPPSLGVWLAAFAIPSLLAIGTTFGVLRWIFRRELRARIDGELESSPLSRHGRWVVAGLGLVSVVLLVASKLDLELGLPTLVAALAVTAVVSIAAKESPIPMAREVSWSTLILVGGLFVLVEAAVHRGALEATASALRWAETLPRTLAVLVTGFAIGVGNNVVNNLPLGLVTGATLQATHPSAPVMHAALIGVDLGPNLAITGSLATILWLLALRKEKIEASFWDFFKVGIRVMPIALAAALFGSLVSPMIAATEADASASNTTSGANPNREERP
jgi:arsenical pump membrane protein